MSLKELSEKLYPVFIKNFVSSSDEPCRLFLSASSMKERAAVRHAVDVSPEKAWAAALTELEKALNGIEPSILRADWVKSSEVVTWSECLERVKAIRRNWFRFGIALDQNYKIALTEQELNANLILYSPDEEKTKGEFQADKAEAYCLKRFNCNLPTISDSDKVEIFETVGAFVQDGMTEPLLMTLRGVNSGRRNIAENDSKVFFDMAMAGANYLVRQCDEEGKFIYGLYPCDDTVVPKYNTHRHFGTLYAMAEAYEVCADEQEKKALGAAVERGLEYGIKNLLNYRKLSDGKEGAYFSEGRVTTIGVSGLALLAFTKWTTVTGTQKYIPLMRALARGIFATQKPDGSFTHILNIKDFSVRKDFAISFYDGEAIFGMLRLYAITKDKELLEVSERAVQRFIDTNYWEKHDHWMSYSMNELTLWKPEEKYFKFGLDNILSFLPKIYKSAAHNPTRLEMIMAAENMIRRMKTLPEMKELLKQVDYDAFYSTADRRAERTANAYFWPEVAMYFQNPERMLGSFFIRADAFRVRIDDVQHTISGLLAYDKSVKDANVTSELTEIENEIKEQPLPEEHEIALHPDEAEEEIATDYPLQVGVLRKSRPRLWNPDSPFLTMFYMSKNFNIELFLFTPQDIDFENKTVTAVTLEGTAEVEKTVPIPKIIDNPSSIFSGNYGRELRALTKDYFFTRHPMNSTKQHIYDMLAADGRFKEFLIDTHVIKDFEHFLTLFEQYKNDVILKPSGSNEGKGVARITFDGTKCVINVKNKKTELHTVEDLKKFYDKYVTVKYVLQPYIASRTRHGNPYDIRIHTRRGAGGKFKVSPYPRIGNEDGVVSNVASGGYTMRLDIFLQVEFGNDWEMLYKRIMDLGNVFPEYYQSFFKHPLFDVGIDVGIQRRENSYDLKIFEINTYCGGSFVRVEDAVNRFKYFRYIDKKLREGSLK